MPSSSLFALVNGLLTVVGMTKTIGAKVEDETYEVFRLVCENEGVTPSDRLRDLVNKFVREEAPFLVIDPNVCLELKRIAEEKGLDWREMTCEAILKFCKKCSEEKKPKEKNIVDIMCEGEEEVKKASTEQKKPKKSILQILKELPEGEGIPVKIVKESEVEKAKTETEKREEKEAPEQESSVEQKLKTFKIVRE